jgi:hypothetical protein
MTLNEIQLRIRSRISETSAGKALVFGFRLGPIHVFCIANMPENSAGRVDDHPLVYVKLSLNPEKQWTEAEGMPRNNHNED